ncbi:hypothetical protein Tco_0724549 [Tanacetum coccineum]
MAIAYAIFEGENSELNVLNLRDSNVEYLRANLNIKGMSNSRRTSLSNVDYILYPSLLRTVTDWKGKPSLRSTELFLGILYSGCKDGVYALKLDENLMNNEAVAREVHATHARIMSGPDPEPMQENQTGSNSRKLHVSLAGTKTLRNMDDEFLVTAYPHRFMNNLKLIKEELVIEEKIQKSFWFYGNLKLYEESDSTILTSHQSNVNSSRIAPFRNVLIYYAVRSLVTPPTNQQEAYNNHTPISIFSLNHFHSSPFSKKWQFGEEIHTADLIEKYSALPGPESIKNQESEKSPKEIIRIKREQGKEKQDSTYSFKHKVALEEFDLKSALFKHMNKNKTANRNPANYHLYHALMEALIADEDAMDKEVAVKVKDHKRKHDSDDEEDDDDDEGPSAGSNQGRSAKRRRPESAASGSAQPPSKDDHQSSKKPRESDASASKQHPALTSTGWQITDTRDDVVNSLMHMLPNNIQITDTNSFIVSKKRSSDSSKKLKGIQTLTPAEQEAADIMKALKESKKMSKRQPGTGGSNEGTGNILGVPDESTVISRASSEGTGSKPGVPDEEKLIL